MADLQSQLDILSKSKKEVTQTSPAKLKGFYHQHPLNTSISQKTLKSIETCGFTAKGVLSYVTHSRVLDRKIGKIGQTYVMANLHKTNCSGFIEGRAPGILTGCEDDFARLV